MPNSFEVPTNKMKDSKERCSVTTLHWQPKENCFYLGLSFAENGVWSFDPESKKWTDLKIEAVLEEKVLAVTSGLRGSLTGDTVCSVLHDGSLTGILASSPKKKSGSDIWKMLFEQSGGFFGAACRHSVLQWTDKKWKVRRFKEPGSLLDCAHIGDFIFGIDGHSIWKEPYLNSEKRETLRNDLVHNRELSRDGADYFWFLAESGRLARMKQGDVRAMQTMKKIPDHEKATEAVLKLTAPSPVDLWMYGLSEPSSTLFRVRKNSVTQEDELENVKTWSDEVTALMTLEAKNEKPARLFLATRKNGMAKVWVADLMASEDPEMMGPKPEFAPLCEWECAAGVGTLAVDGTGHLWAGEGFLGCGETSPEKPRIFDLGPVI